jgi:dipeptidyl aminopeptidase/acylaminoacyl peptidase
MNSDGSHKTQLTFSAVNSSPDWSINNKILFTSNTNAQNFIFTMNADGSDQTQITPIGRQLDSPKWSPDGEKIVFEGLSHKVIPDAVMNKKQDLLEAIPLAAVPVVELQLSGHTIVNIIVPAAVAAAMTDLTPKEIARKAVEGAYISSAIPGGIPRAEEVAKRALKIMSEL